MGARSQDRGTPGVAHGRSTEGGGSAGPARSPQIRRQPTDNRFAMRSLYHSVPLSRVEDTSGIFSGCVVPVGSWADAGSPSACAGELPGLRRRGLETPSFCDRPELAADCPPLVERPISAERCALARMAPAPRRRDISWIPRLSTSSPHRLKVENQHQRQFATLKLVSDLSAAFATLSGHSRLYLVSRPIAALSRLSGLFTPVSRNQSKFSRGREYGSKVANSQIRDLIRELRLAWPFSRPLPVGFRQESSS